MQAPGADSRGRMTLAFRAIIAAAVVGLLCGGCAHDPNPVGAGVLPKSDTPGIQTDTLYPTLHSTGLGLILTQNSDTRVYSWVVDRIMLGNTQNIEANAFLMFSSFPDTMIGVTITSAVVQLKAAYTFGNPVGSVMFTAYRALTTWREDSLTYDSLSRFPSTYYSPTPVSNLVSQSVQDSSWFQFSIDPGMVTDWFTTAIDTGTINQGIILRPMPGTVIKGFASFNAADPSAWPKLTVNYVRDGIPGVFTDTLGFAKYIAYENPANLILDPKLMYVQEGISYRAFMDFDLSHFPIPSSVHRAQLELTLDSAASAFNLATRDSLFSFFVTDDGLISTGTASLSGRPSPSLYTFSVGTYVQSWEKGTLLRRISIAGFAENNSFDRFVFYGENAPKPAWRPRLIITHSPAQ